MSKFVIYNVASGVKFKLTAANGRTIAASEVYETHAACCSGIESVKKCAPGARVEDHTLGHNGLSHPKFELYEDKTGQFRFRLKARNGKIIAVSEGYTTKSSCCSGIESVRKNAPDAQIEDA